MSASRIRTINFQQQCSICYVNFKDHDKIMIMSDCEHYFHDTCIESWLDNKNYCPLCRCCITTDELLRHIITMCVFNRISGFYNCQEYRLNLDMIKDIIRTIKIRDISINLDDFDISTRIKMIDIVYERRDIICESLTLNPTTFNVLEHPIVKIYNVYSYRNVLLNNLLRKPVFMTSRREESDTDSDSDSDSDSDDEVRQVQTRSGMLLRGAIQLINAAVTR